MSGAPHAFRRAARALTLLAGLAACAPEAPLGTMDVTLVVRDLLARPPEWEEVRVHPRLGPTVDVICPAVRHGLDGADMLSLVLPPPSEVRFRIDDDVGPARLRLRAGVDLSTVKLGERLTQAYFVFEVRVGDVLADRVKLMLSPERVKAGSEWRDVGGTDGIAVEPGDVVTLTTYGEDLEGGRVDPRGIARVGFGGIRLERTFPVARVRSSRDAPNVVLVVMDTLRRDRLATYGYGRPTSPSLDRLAARGTVFDEAYTTSSWTWPSTASLFTGMQPEEHGVRDSGSCFLAFELGTLAEALQLGGVTTAAWSGNPLIAASRNFDQGFESFDDGEDFRKTGAFWPAVERWLSARGDERFFLYLQLVEPHQPYDALPEARALFGTSEGATALAQDVVARLDRGRGADEDGGSLVDELVPPAEQEDVDAIYDACVWSGDHWLGRLLDALDRLALTERTIVVFTSDHGEELFDRYGMGHSKTVYGELVRAPLVLAGPGVPAGVRVRTPVSNALVAPTLARLSGRSADGAVGRELRGPVGESLLDLARAAKDGGAPRRGERAVLYSTELGFWKGHKNVTIRGMRLGDHTVQVAPEAGDWGQDPATLAGDARLFDLRVDPREERDLIPTGSPEGSPEQARLRAELARRFDALERAFFRPRHATGRSTELLLERIGYAGH